MKDFDLEPPISLAPEEQPGVAWGPKGGEVYVDPQLEDISDRPGTPPSSPENLQFAADMVEALAHIRATEPAGADPGVVMQRLIEDYPDLAYRAGIIDSP